MDKAFLGFMITLLGFLMSGFGFWFGPDGSPLGGAVVMLLGIWVVYCGTTLMQD